MVAYDGSLQAARAVAAFQATGLGELGIVHIISVNASANEAAEHAKRARALLAATRLSRFAHACRRRPLRRR